MLIIHKTKKTFWLCWLGDHNLQVIVLIIYGDIPQNVKDMITTKKDLAYRRLTSSHKKVFSELENKSQINV